MAEAVPPPWEPFVKKEVGAMREDMMVEIDHLKGALQIYSAMVDELSGELRVDSTIIEELKKTVEDHTLEIKHLKEKVGEHTNELLALRDAFKLLESGQGPAAPTKKE